MATKGEHLLSVNNAMRILHELADAREMGITQLSGRLGLPKSTVFRLVHTLLGEGLVEQDPGSRKFRVGMGALVVGSAVYRRTELQEEMIPHLVRLSRRLGDVMRLGIYSRGYVVYLCKVPDDKDTSGYSGVGRRTPVHCTAIGKLLLAFQTQAEIDAVLSGALPRLTQRTVTDPEKLREQVRHIREQGFAVTYEERVPGLCSVAVPVFDGPTGVGSAVSVTGPRIRFPAARVNEVVWEMRNFTQKAGERVVF